MEDDGGFSYYGGSAIYAGNNYTLQMGPKLTVNGLVDLKVNANGVFANGGHSDIYFKGGNIEINKDNTKGVLRTAGGVRHHHDEYGAGRK